MKKFLAVLSLVAAKDLRRFVRFLRCIPWLALLGVVAGIVASISFGQHGMPTLGWVAGGFAFGNWVMASASFACDLSNEFGF